MSEGAAASGFEVPEPILNGPYDPPARHWHLQIEEGLPPEERPGRRRAGYWYRDPDRNIQAAAGSRGVWREMPLVNAIRDRIEEWRRAGRPGATRTTADLIAWWERDGRSPRLFFAQREAAETIIFLTEARPDFLAGLAIPDDDPGEQRKAAGYAGFRRHCCKLATGTGKSTIAAMLAAWSILNKAADRSDARFSDTVLILCPNVTIRSRLSELDPACGEASIYVTRDLVPPALRADLARGRVIIRNWHVLEPQQPAGSAGARVVRAGQPETRKEWIRIGPADTTARGSRYFTPESYAASLAAGELAVIAEDKAEDGSVRKALVESTRWIESDTALVNRVLGRGGGQNILVINDEAHHAYRIPPREAQQDESDNGEAADEDEKEEREADRQEATVWIDGLDRIQRIRGINQCIDLSATPYYLGRMGGATNTVFPWTISDFGLTDAIESGLVKVPQLVAQDSSGQLIPSYFNIWQWILPKLTAAERGSRRGSPKPEAILKWAHTPITIMASLWQSERARLLSESDDARPPVFILVAKNKRIARTLFEWIAEDIRPPGVSALNIPELRNRAGETNTIRVDTGVVLETDSGNPKSDENAWMRFTLDTVGRENWPEDSQGRPIYPEGFAELAAKLARPLHPPGRDVRSIVSVGMLTEGWDCNTVSHVVGLRPFQSQLLCEQVVGRALRRRSYDIVAGGKLEEEVAKVFGVPFEIVPFKATAGTKRPKPPERRIFAVPQKARYAITVPRVLGYSIAVRNRIGVSDWSAVAGLVLDPMRLPPDSELAAMLNQGRPSINAPGGSHRATLAEFRERHRAQQLSFQMAADLTLHYCRQPTCEAPPHVLFPQVLRIVERYIAEKVTAPPPAEQIDAFLSPYYGWIIERLLAAIRPDIDAGEVPEVPDIDRDRPSATADISVFTNREVREVARSHVNLAVFDTMTWEQSASYHLDHHPAVAAHIRNFGLNFTIPYLHNGQPREYLPDFVARLAGPDERYLIAEVKGADWENLAEVKKAAAIRWCAAINATDEFGRWDYLLAYKVSDIVAWLDHCAAGQAAA